MGPKKRGGRRGRGGESLGQREAGSSVSAADDGGSAPGPETCSDKSIPDFDMKGLGQQIESLKVYNAPLPLRLEEEVAEKMERRRQAKERLRQAEECLMQEEEQGKKCGSEMEAHKVHTTDCSRTLRAEDELKASLELKERCKQSKERCMQEEKQYLRRKKEGQPLRRKREVQDLWRQKVGSDLWLVEEGQPLRRQEEERTSWTSRHLPCRRDPDLDVLTPSRLRKMQENADLYDLEESLDASRLRVLHLENADLYDLEGSLDRNFCYERQRLAQGNR